MYPTDPVFVSDGANSDSANIQGIFSEDCVVGRVGIPAYPVYVDSNVISGRTGEGYGMLGYEGLSLHALYRGERILSRSTWTVELIDSTFAAPTIRLGQLLSKEQLQKFVNYANEHRAIIFYDSAYASL